MNQAFQEDLIALSLILNQDHTVSVGYSPAEIADAETASGICFPIALKTVYETVGKDSILAKGFYAPCEIRILHEPRTYCFKPFGEYIGFEFADMDGKRYAYYPFRRRDCDYKCYEKLERIYDKPHEYFANISDERRKAPDYSGFLDFFANRIMERMKYIITFTSKKALKDYVTVCQSFGAQDFQTYLPYTFRGEETHHAMRDLKAFDAEKYVTAICFFVNYVSRAKDSGFVADDASVTFTRKFAKDITIPYIDIDTVAVYTERKSGNGKASSFYVETILITTLDGQDFEFKAVMDIRPNGRLEATGFMDKMLEMGKFSVLKKHIELQRIDRKPVVGSTLFPS